MSKIKSIEELVKIREKYKKDLEIRKTDEGENKIRVIVGMATCGIASGSRDTINAIFDEVSKQELKNVTVVQGGCLGYCYAEPTVEIISPDRGIVIYGKIDADRGRELVKRHIMQGELIDEWIIKQNFETV